MNTFAVRPLSSMAHGEGRSASPSRRFDQLSALLSTDLGAGSLSLPLQPKRMVPKRQVAPHRVCRSRSGRASTVASPPPDLRCRRLHCADRPSDKLHSNAKRGARAPFRGRRGPGERKHLLSVRPVARLEVPFELFVERAQPIRLRRQGVGNAREKNRRNGQPEKSGK